MTLTTTQHRVKETSRFIAFEAKPNEELVCWPDLRPQAGVRLARDSRNQRRHDRGELMKARLVGAGRAAQRSSEDALGRAAESGLAS